MSDASTARPAVVADVTRQASLKSTDRLLVWLVFLLICVSIIATLPQTLDKLRYISIPLPGGELGFRWMREGMLAVVVAVSTIVALAERRRIPRAAVLAFFLVSAWAVVVALWSVMAHDTPPLAMALGVRLVQYAPLILVGYLLMRSVGYPSLHLFASLLRWYVALQALVAAYQVLGGTRIGWDRTVFGYRAFGTFVSYNQFGATMVLCALTFCIAALWGRRFSERTRFDRWMLFSGLAALTSASRTAIVLTFFVIAYYYLATVRFGKALKLGVTTLAPILLVAFYFIANESVFTGRETSAALQDESRVSIWRTGLAAFETPSDILFGLGLGEGAATPVGDIAAGEADQREITANPHSAYISLAASFGWLGVLGYVGALLMTLAKAPRVLAMVFVITVAALGMPLGFLQVFPANALMFFLWGCLLASKRSYAARPAVSASIRSSSTIALPFGRA